MLFKTNLNAEIFCSTFMSYLKFKRVPIAISYELSELFFGMDIFQQLKRYPLVNDS